MPSSSDLLLAALRHHQAGEFEQAEGLYCKVLATDPQNADALHLLGVLAHQVGRSDVAVELIGQAITANGGQAIFHNNLGAAYRALGKYPEAQACYERAVQLDPRYADAHSNLGTVLHALGKPAEAAAAYRRALEIAPNFAEAHNNLGNVLKEQGDVGHAAECYRRAIALRGDFALAHNNLGSLAFEAGKLDEAIPAFRAALQHDPRCVEAHGNLGLALLAQGYFSEAVACFEQSLALHPDDAMRIRAAIAQPVIHESAESMRQRRRSTEEKVAQLLKEALHVAVPEHGIGITAMNLLYQGENERALLEQIAELYSRAAPSLNFVSPHCKGKGKAPGKGERLRIGIVSRHLHNHSNSRLNLGIIRELSRERFHITVFRFPGYDDTTSELVRQAADETVTLPVQLAQAQREIAARQLDMLFYTDIGMEPLTYCLAFARLAPMQCTTWGVPATTGIKSIDCFLSSVDLEPENAQTYYTEKLVLLDNLPTYYYRPQIASPAKSRRDLDLAEDGTLYICPQSLFKVHPDFDAVVAGILRGDPTGRLVLIDGPHRHWRELLLQRWRRTLGDVLPRVQFLRSLSNDDFLQLLSLADVMLDPLHFGGGNTTYEALAFGTPIITCPGTLMRGRVTYACYLRMGVMDCVAKDAADYVRLAVELGTDAERRRDVRKRLRDAAEVLYENRALIRELEEFFAGAGQ